MWKGEDWGPGWIRFLRERRSKEARRLMNERKGNTKLSQTLKGAYLKSSKGRVGEEGSCSLQMWFLAPAIHGSYHLKSPESLPCFLIDFYLIHESTLVRYIHFPRPTSLIYCSRTLLGGTCAAQIIRRPHTFLGHGPAQLPAALFIFFPELARTPWLQHSSMGPVVTGSEVWDLRCRKSNSPSSYHLPWIPGYRDTPDEASPLAKQILLLLLRTRISPYQNQVSIFRKPLWSPLTLVWFHKLIAPSCISS